MPDEYEHLRESADLDRAAQSKPVHSGATGEGRQGTFALSQKVRTKKWLASSDRGTLTFRDRQNTRLGIFTTEDLIFLDQHFEDLNTINEAFGATFVSTSQDMIHRKIKRALGRG